MPLPTVTPTKSEVTQLFCTDCGMRNSADSKYCKECGQKINDGYRTMMLSIEDLQAVQTEQNQERLTKLLDMAFWHNQAGNMDAAVLACEAALTIHPDSTTAHSLLGSLYEKKGDDAKAIEHFEAVVRLNPDSAADAAKLDQVCRGVHVKAVQPPPAYKWLPPALVSMNWSKWKPNVSGPSQATISRPIWPERWPKPSPWVAGSAVFGLVLIAGMIAIHPGRTVGAAPHPKNTMREADVNTLALGNLGAPGTVPNTSLTPQVLRGGPNSRSQTIVALPADPFGETLPPGTKTTPLVPPARSVRSMRVASAGHRSGPSLTLPPLNLHAEPISSDGGGLAPAPVSVPPGMAMPSVPQHTVVVSNLGGAPAPSAQTASMTTSSPNDLASHIHISINNSPSDNSVSISDHDDAHPAPRQAQAGGGQDGAAFQQTALALQQQGQYRRARTAYQKAIHAYQAQIAAGRDTDAASQGLAASQTGLQICEQSVQ